MPRVLVAASTPSCNLSSPTHAATHTLAQSSEKSAKSLLRVFNMTAIVPQLA
jgi:hypothetical protein